MHISHALRTSDFTLERRGEPEPLAALWGGFSAEEDRLAVLLNEPLDPVACANLLVATSVLFYEQLRAVDAGDGFFRYPDTFLVGVGVQPGEFRMLDVWPPHKSVSVRGDHGPEPLLEALTDRRVTLLAVPEAGLRLGGPVVRSTWNTLRAVVRRFVTYASPIGRPIGPVSEAELVLVGNPTVEEYVEHAIEATDGVDREERRALFEHRRALDREPLAPAEAFGVLGGAEAAAPLLGVAEVLPPGKPIA